MQVKSLWTKDVKFKKIKRLKENIVVDILIIGGGITGLTTAYYLKDKKKNICLVDQGIVGMGVSSRTTGKINYLQETIYSDLEKMYSFDVAKKYYDSQKLAIRELKRIIWEERIKCDFTRVDSYVFTKDKDEVKKLKYEKEILEKLGAKIYDSTKVGNGVSAKYAIYVKDTYVFHPLKYLDALKNICNDCGVDIYEKTRIRKMEKCKDGYLCQTDSCTIKAKKVILACHYPYFLKPYFFPLKVYNEKSYVTASIVKSIRKETFITSTLPCKSVRYHKDDKNYFIYLGNSHKICNSFNEKDNFSNLLNELDKIGLKPTYIWSNEDVMTIDKIPYIGKLEKDNNNLFIGTGYNTWGMSNGTLAGLILSDFVLGKDNEYKDLFSPLRINCLENIDGYLSNIGGTLKSFVGNKIKKNKYWYGDKVSFEVRNGKSVAIYNDGTKEHIVLSNCPHLGCTLLFNEVEKTWDCPCHASRFNLDGKCIKGPSNYDISYIEDEEEI